MLNVKNEGIILEKTDREFENQAVLNPSCVELDGIVHMFYRAISNNHVSSIGYCQLRGSEVINRLTHPVLVPEYEYERQGVEDPRIVCLDGIYYLFYTAYDGKNALVAYATSPDLVNFSKMGIISPLISYKEAKNFLGHARLEKNYYSFADKYQQRIGEDVLLWEKDAFIFPKRINNKIALIHRILPGIQIIYFDDFPQLTREYWAEYLKNLDQYIVLENKEWFENRNVGGGCPPIETKDGWLLIYHAVENTPTGKIYHASAALLDKNDPTQVIGRLTDPLFSPEESWEKDGYINNVVFPSGAVIQNGRLYIYYGAADHLIAAKSVGLVELLEELKSKQKVYKPRLSNI